jgi:hypothetical protein
LNTKPCLLVLADRSRRRSLYRHISIIAATLSFSTLSACGVHAETVTLDVVYFNYTARPIFDAFIDGKAGGTSSPYPATGGGTISGVTLTLGPKQVSWRLDGPPGAIGNGDKIVSRNSPILSDVPKDANYLGVHIYPDTTVELIALPHYPRPTEKGIAFARQRK